MPGSLADHHPSNPRNIPAGVSLFGAVTVAAGTLVASTRSGEMIDLGTLGGAQSTTLAVKAVGIEPAKHSARMTVIEFNPRSRPKPCDPSIHPTRPVEVTR